MTKIAAVGTDIPHDVLVATGRYIGPLGWNIDRPFPHAERWLENKFPPWAFSILEDWATGALNHLSAVVFSRGDDSAHRLYYYVSELRRRGLIAGPEPLVFDVAKIGRSTSADHTVAAVQRLADELNVNQAALEQAIRDTNARRKQHGATTVEGNVCLLAGSAPPDLRVHHEIEKAHWTAVGQTLDDAWRWLGSVVPEGTPAPAAAIGRQIYDERTGARAFYDRTKAILENVRKHAAKAVVLWYIEEDEAQIWHLPELRKSLANASLPILVLTRCDWRFNDEAGSRIATFLKELNP
jgi:hypothetical protein